MRDRKNIETQANRFAEADDTFSAVDAQLLLEVLLDIRDQMTLRGEQLGKIMELLTSQE